MAMKKRMGFFSILMLLLLLGMFLPEAATAQRRRFRRLLISYRGNFSWVNVFINGRSFGRINKYGRKRIRKRAGREYKITLKRAGRVSSKTVYLPSVGNRRVTFYSPTRKGGRNRRFGKIRINLDGRFRWAQVYINGRPRGRVHRGEQRTFRLRTGRMYRIRLRRRGRVRRRRVRLTRRRSVRRLNFHF